MGSPLHKLTLMCATSNEAALINCLDSLADELPLYLHTHGSARGTMVDLESASEKVKDAMKTSVFTMVLPTTQVDLVLSAVKSSCGKAHLSYWLELAEDFGLLE